MAGNFIHCPIAHMGVSYEVYWESECHVLVIAGMYTV